MTLDDLANIVLARVGTLHVTHELAYSTIEYRDGGGADDNVEKRIVPKLLALWPDRHVTVEIEGGCDTCGFKRLVTISLTPPISLEAIDVSADRGAD